MLQTGEKNFPYVKLQMNSAPFTLEELDSSSRMSISSPSSRLSSKLSVSRNIPMSPCSSENGDAMAKLEKKTQATLQECCYLMEQIHAYTKNTTLRGSPTPQSPIRTPRKGESYCRSPYGRELVISDCSPHCTPKKAKRKPYSSPYLSDVKYGSDTD